LAIDKLEYERVALKANIDNKKSMANKILITGGTGHLGQKIVQLIKSKEYEVSILTSKSGLKNEDNITYFTGNLSQNIGLKEATKDINTIIHCASNPRDFEKVDIEGTQNLLNSIDKNSIKHLVYISIVGIHKSDYPYYQAKLKVENILENSGIPYTIVRTTQFHSFVFNLIQSLINETASEKSVLKIPEGLKFQSIATDEVAKLLVKTALQPPQGLLPDFGGPEMFSFDEMTATYLKKSQLNWNIEPEPTNNIRHQLFRTGINLCPDNAFGKETWELFLEKSI